MPRWPSRVQIPSSAPLTTGSRAAASFSGNLLLEFGGIAKWLRRRSAKPLFSGSNPDAASKSSHVFPVLFRFRPQRLYRVVRSKTKKTGAAFVTGSAGLYAKFFSTSLSSSRLFLSFSLPFSFWFPSFLRKGCCAGDSPAVLACARRVRAGLGFGACTPGG